MEPGSIARILVVEPDAHTRSAVVEVLGEGHECLEATNASDALSMLKTRDIDLVFSEFSLPDGSGLDILEFVGDCKPASAVVMVTDHDDPGVARKALELGAF